ncbi:MULTISPECIES: hypothetical protein [unclassified Streptomyces]|uniref:hypothetical protein n=1 Tax=unclassified Streptomyces TaxID=2593676 RepID=UPI001488E074|nr:MULTISPECIES: hypothetical protein [unclassified Streptomyces]
MIGEAVDTLLTLGWGLLAWIVLTSLAAALALHAVIAVAWWTVRATWRALRRPLSGPSWARGRLQARRIARARVKPPHDYQEAA